MNQRNTLELMLIEDGWIRLSYRQRRDVMRVIRALNEYSRGLIHDDDFNTVVESIEPMRVRCAICLFNHDYVHALDFIEQMEFCMR